MKTAHALFLLLALLTFTGLARAQTYELASGCGIASYGNGATYALMPVGDLNVWNLPAQTAVRVEVKAEAWWYYQITNHAAPISSYQFNQGMTYQVHGPLGTSSFQLCNTVCSGALPTGELHEVNVHLEDVPLFDQLSYVTRVADLPIAVTVSSYGNVQEWPGIPSPWLLTHRRPWSVASRNAGGVRLIVTAL